MRKALPIILFLSIAAACLSGCRDAETRRTLRRMMGSTVVLPEKVTCVQNGEVFPMPEELRSRPKLIVFVDSTECSLCKIDKIIHYRELFELADESESFELMILLSPIRSELSFILDHLRYSPKSYPIYVDERGLFRSINKWIPNSASLHSMTVNCGNQVVLVGDPVYNNSIMELFLKTIL